MIHAQITQNLKEKPDCISQIGLQRKLEDGNSCPLKVTNNSDISAISVEVDGCLIDDNKTKRCDYIVAQFEDSCVFGKVALIELKSKYFEDKIFEQLFCTIRRLQIPTGSCKCYLVLFKYFPQNNTRRQRLVKRFVDAGLYFRILVGSIEAGSSITLEDLLSDNSPLDSIKAAKKTLPKK